ncbi:FkbM family methyltransferase [Mesorhizobium sp. M0199]|uniref:FkbM family methyltransferase n=1 Tax=Mesorhizobium sp. M0199 TaxID=2956911 RepID=UPI00333949B8
MSLDSLKLRARNAARRVGLEIKPSNLHSRFDLRLVELLKAKQATVLLDVGANRGQFATEILKSGYGGTVVSFEALPHVYQELSASAAAFGKRWVVAPRAALSDSEGHVNFNVTKNFASSSLLQPTSYMLGKGEPLTILETIEVPTRRLDSLVRTLGLVDESFFLKMDVQGAEHLVLAGAPEIIKRSVGVLLEVHLVDYYEGQPTWKQLDDIMTSNGLRLWDVHPFLRGVHGRLEGMDIVYVRPDDASVNAGLNSLG